MKIIVTAIGSMSAECVISGLCRLGYQVVGTDIYPVEYHPVSRQCVSFYQVPRADSDGFVESISQISESEGAQYVLPLTDPEIDSLTRCRQYLASKGVELLLAPSPVVESCRRKDVMADRLNGCASFSVIPTFSSLEEAVSHGNACRYVAKKVDGRSSEGIVFGSMKELAAYDLSGYIIQPFISGEIITIDVVSDGKGGVAICPRQELLRTKNGAGTVVKSLPVSDYQTMVNEIVSALRIVGGVNMEFIRSADGTCYLMDINPRFSAGIGFSMLMGFDAVAMHLGAFGLSKCGTQPWSAKPGQIFVKRFADYIGRC